jgi:hypothetical protein
MPVCPLCESDTPAADACATCGRPFASADRRAPPVAPLAELEPTRHEPVPEPRDRLAELEATAAAPVAVEATGSLADLEVTHHPPAPRPDDGPDPFDLDPLPLEPTHAAPVPDAAPRGPVVCRYCRAPATGWERLCLRCGMRLPVPRPPAREPAGAAEPCRDCGTPSNAPTCPACGARRARG